MTKIPKRKCRQCHKSFKPATKLTRYCPSCRSPKSREWFRQSRKQRRDTIKAATIQIEASDIFERDGWRCYLCGVELDPASCGSNAPDEATIDHKLPISRGGRHTLENVATCCRACNAIKRERTPDELDMKKFLAKRHGQ